MLYFVFVWPGSVQSGPGEGKMSLAPVWLWGGSSRPARKTALSEASVCVIVGLQEERERAPLPFSIRGEREKESVKERGG